VFSVKKCIFSVFFSCFTCVCQKNVVILQPKVVKRFSNMNKKCIYLAPVTEIVPVKAETQLLVESPAEPAAAPVNAKRNTYGEANNEVW
jgi:hypothetical protein